MKCPSCDNAALVHETKDIPFSQNGSASTIEAVIGDFCLVCGDILLDTKQGERHAKLVRHREAVNLIAGLWKDHTDGPIDGVEYQKKIRSQW